MKFKSLSDILNFRFDDLPYSKWTEIENNDFNKEMLKSTPTVFNFFKTVLTEHIELENNIESSHTFCNVTKLKNIRQKIENGTLSVKKDSTLIIAGTDHKCWGQCKGSLSVLSEHFSTIYSETFGRDYRNLGNGLVTAFPMGTIMAYLLRVGEQNCLPIINNSPTKTKLIGTAFGSKWPRLNNKDYRKSLISFAEKHSWIEDFFCPPPEYFKNLSAYKFFASPLGNGVQTPKICESILCETIPVVTNHPVHRDLRDIHDLPLLIIDKWEDLTEDFLYNEWNTKYKFIDWSAEKSKFLVDNFADLYLK